MGDCAALDDASLSDLVSRIDALAKWQARWLIAITGSPASGKSVLAEVICKELNTVGRPAQVIPMDGFHLDNPLLEARGLRKRKGAPETFDAEGFVELVRRVKRGGDVIYPLFDREKDIAIAGAGEISAECDIAVFEGNYLLFDEPPWRALRDHWDISVRLDVPEQILLDRCVQRWLDHGRKPDDARTWAEQNDLVNARRITGAALPADVTLVNA